MQRKKVNYKNEEHLSGRNITATVLDTGISDITDFRGRIKAFKDITEGKNSPYDDNGHGSHVSGILGGVKGIAPLRKPYRG